MEGEFDPIVWPYKLNTKNVLFSLVYEGQPIAKGRPRLGRYRVYTPTKTRVHEDALIITIRNLYKGEIDRKSKFGLRCIFYRSNKQRIDCDNLIKCVADAISRSGIVWYDDNQCLEIIGRLFIGAENPRTEFAVYKIKDTTPKNFCAECGKEFEITKV
jgi:Holliday junction resolvase RusA-like endonuclease|tara:strand:+ start:7329 stop:7802 length:474 start_codon:yes stop_codon:yes gene_type:complete